MKETLLQRCQREARELFEVNGLLEDKNWLGKGMAEQKIEVLLSLAIANTLKQAAESLEGMKDREEQIRMLVEQKSIDRIYTNGKIDALTDAQRLLLGEDNENV
jgi:hypothetical protein